MAVEQVKGESPQLQGDRIARREVETRLAEFTRPDGKRNESCFGFCIRWYSAKLMGRAMQPCPAQRVGI